MGEKALTNAIWHLRQALEGVDGNKDVIETIRKGGYRLLAKPVYFEPQTSNSSTSLELLTEPVNKAVKPSLNLKLLLASLLLLVITTIVAYGLIYKSSHPASLLVESVSKEPGSELFPSVSPDGRYLAYKWRRQGVRSNLFIKDLKQPELPAKQLTFDSLKKTTSVWSMDGKHLYFSRKNSANGHCEVIKINVKTKQEKVITECSQHGNYYYLDLSPNGKTLAFHGSEEGESRSAIYFIDLEQDGGLRKRFSCASNCSYKDRDMAFSPDGEQIAVTRRENQRNENIYLINLSTKEEQKLTFNQRDILGLAWHPSGEKIVFGSQKADRRNGYVIDLDNNSIDDLHIDGFSYPEFSKTSSELFYQKRSEGYQIASLKLNETVLMSPTYIIDSYFNHRYPDYSSLTKKVVYTSNESGTYELWSANVHGMDVEQLTDLGRDIKFPKWSHDGKKISFLAAEENTDIDKIYIFDLETRKISMLETPFSKHSRPSWSLDDQSIFSSVNHQGHRRLYRFDVYTGNYNKLTNDPSLYGVMIDEDNLLYTNQNRQLWLKDLSEPLAPSVLLLDKQQFGAINSWAYDGGGIYFLQKESGYRLLKYYSLQTKEHKKLFRLPSSLLKNYTSISYNSDQDSLIFTSNQIPKSDISKLKHPLLN